MKEELVPKRRIEIEYSLSFENQDEQRMFFEMFYALLKSRVGRKPVTSFDIKISLAALCMLPWPGKSTSYRESIEKIKRLYFSNPESRILIIYSLLKGTTTKFKRLQSESNPYFTDIYDLFSNPNT